jgi:hypothetical protein
MFCLIVEKVVYDNAATTNDNAALNGNAEPSVPSKPPSESSQTSSSLGERVRLWRVHSCWRLHLHFLCDWESCADVVAVKLEARDQLVIGIHRIRAESCMFCIRLLGGIEK